MPVDASSSNGKYQRLTIGIIGIVSFCASVLLLAGFIEAFVGNPGPVFAYVREAYNPPVLVYMGFITLPWMISIICVKALFPEKFSSNK